MSPALFLLLMATGVCRSPAHRCCASKCKGLVPKTCTQVMEEAGGCWQGLPRRSQSKALNRDWQIDFCSHFVDGAQSKRAGSGLSLPGHRGQAAVPYEDELITGMQLAAWGW